MRYDAVWSTIMPAGGRRRRGVLRLKPQHQPTHPKLAQYYESKGDKELAAERRRHIKSTK
jgi:hypothetical protein